MIHVKYHSIRGWIVGFLLIFTILLFGWIVANAHWEDPQTCNDVVGQFSKTEEAEWEPLYNGISEDGRDYIYRFHFKASQLVVEQHHILLPPAQWEDKDTPTYMPMVLSVWLDWDGNGHYGEWYLFPRQHMDCEDALHFIWDEDHQTYRLYATGKERT